MSDVRKVFEHGKAFIPFITAADPDLETTEKLLLAIAESGADLIEVGVPFSDPMAEGPVIMAADERALRNNVTSDEIFELVSRVSKRVDCQFAVMTYANLVYSYGIAEYAKAMKEAGFSSLILPDISFEEKNEFSVPVMENGINYISLIAPTSEDRIKTIAADADGFIYVVSSLGVTGMRDRIETDISKMVRMVKAVKDIPCAIGFGISRPDQAYEMAKKSDGVIVGSAIVKIVEKYGRDSVPYVKDFVKSMKDACRKADQD